MNPGFIKLKRSPETLELLQDPNAFILLTVIAFRARRNDEFNIHNLKSGEALIGDYKKCGLTHRQYRTAMKRLGQWGFAAFKPTTRGTVATLCDTRVYDINEVGGDKQTTNARPLTRMRRMRRSILPTLTSGNSLSCCSMASWRGNRTSAGRVFIAGQVRSTA